MKMHVEIKMKNGTRYHCEDVLNFYFMEEGKNTTHQVIEIGGIRRTFEQPEITSCKVWME